MQSHTTAARKYQMFTDPTAPNFSAVIQKGIEYLVVMALGWFIASFMFQRRLDAFEAKVVAPLKQDVSMLKSARFVTTDDLEKAVKGLKEDVRQYLDDLKEYLKEVKHKA